MAVENTPVNASMLGVIPENQLVYTAEEVSQIIQNERALINEKINEVNQLIENNNACLDDMCTALNDIVELQALDRDESDLRSVIDRLNTIQSCLQKLRAGIMD